MPLPVRVAHRRAHEIGAGPVVELAVGDADDLADHAVRGTRDRDVDCSAIAPLQDLPGLRQLGRPWVTRV